MTAQHPQIVRACIINMLPCSLLSIQDPTLLTVLLLTPHGTLAFNAEVPIPHICGSEYINFHTLTELAFVDHVLQL
jgi:hypothetical protein